MAAAVTVRRRGLSLVSIVLAAGGLLLAAGSSQAAPTGAAQSIAVPSYFYPDYSGGSQTCSNYSPGLWAQMENAAPTVRRVIINPSSGPGSSINYDYACQVDHTQATGIWVLGYVHTSYGDRSLATVKAEIDKHYDWYGVDGIFVDETPTSCSDQADLDYYTELYNYVKGKGGHENVILNPGAMPAGNCWMSITDIIVTFEDSYSSYVNAASPPSWTNSYGSDRFWELVYDASSSQWPDVLSRSKSRRAGWIYATDDVLSNPWDVLPTYWSTEVAKLPRIYRWRQSNDGTNTTFKFFHNAPWTWQRVYIDHDQSTSTGFQHGGIGASYMIENGGLYSYTGTGTNWSWSWVSSVTPSRTDDSVSWTVARSSIGESGYPNSSDAVFEAELSGGPEWASAKYTHGYSAATGNITSYFAENDYDTVYYQGQFASYTFNHVFIDTDVSSGTGYPIGGTGADYMIENGTLYRYVGSGGSWSWQSLGSANQVVNGSTRSWTVSRSTVGETGGAADTARLVFHGSGGSSEYVTPVYTVDYSE
jgi:hypothetical protein